MTYEERPPGQPTSGPPGQSRAADERARILVESVRDHAIFMLDPQGVIVSWSPGAELLHGYTEAEVVGKPLSVLYPPAEGQAQLAQTREALRLRDEFLSIASHELMTPITSLQLQLESVRERIEQLDDRVASKVHRAARSSAHLVKLVESLLDVSRIATGRFELRVEHFDLAESVREVIERFQDAASQAGCELSVQIEGSILGSWDRLRIEQVLTNLLANALKYAAGTPVAVSLTRETETAILTVRDRGPGVPEEALPRIFNRFERAASIQHYGGLGLGLYVVQEIVRAHNGMATAHNLPDEGACFSVQLPLTLSASTQETSKSGELH